MWSLETIQRVNAEIGMKAKNKKPFLLESESQLEDMPPFPFPSLGDAADKIENRRIEGLFVDKTGFDNSGRSLSPDGLKRRLRQLLNEHGPVLVAIYEEGQFQIRIGVWNG